MDTVVITRHPALVEYLREIGLISHDALVLAHASIEDVRNKRVIGVLPMRLAAFARRVIEVPLDLSPEDRGKELSLDRIRQIAGAPVEYSVFRVDSVSVADLDAAETSKMTHLGR